MHLDIKHNPETILEYFQILKEWNKTKFEVDKFSEEVQENSEVKNSREELHRIQSLIFEKSSLSESIHEHLNKISQAISNNEDELYKSRSELTKLNNELSNLIENIKRLEGIQKARSYKDEFIPLSTLTKKIQYFIATINHDIRIICLDLQEALSTVNFLILFQYVLGILIASILLITFLDATSFIFMLILASYLTWRLLSVLNSYKSNREKQISDRQSRYREEIMISDCKEKRHELEAVINELTIKFRNHAAHLNQANIQRDELTSQVTLLHDELLDLDHSYNKQMIISQQVTEKIVEQIYLNKKQHLSYLEALTKKWLEEAIKDLSEKVKNKLRLVNPEFEADPNALKAAPIPVWVGVTERKEASLIIQDELVGQLESEEVADLFASEDLKSEKAYEENQRRYRIYEVSIIFLCKEFFSYYTCYFNFVRHIRVNEKYSECLYDSVAFTKLQETSYVNPNNDDSKKRSYSKSLTISTNSGKNIRFQIPSDCIKGKISQIDTIANTIRCELRRRMNEN